MRTFLFSLLVFCFMGSSNVLQAEGIEFFHGTWAEALDEAANTDRLIFVDAYTTWCGPCKAMAKNVFTQKNVGDFYNDNFINVKLDMEKGEGLKFRSKYSVTAYPTLLYIDENGKLVHQSRGGKKPEQFIMLGKSAMKKNDKSPEFATKYEAGERSPKLLKGYAYALLKANKDHLKIANEYLKTQKDLKTEENLLFIYDFASESDSRIFDLMIKNREAISAFKSEQEINDKIERACSKTVQKAVKFQSPDLLSEAKEKMKLHNPAGAAKFDMTANMDYYKGLGQMSNYFSASQKYAKKFAKNDPQELLKMASNYEKTVSSVAGLKQAEKWMKWALKKEEKYSYYHTQAALLYKMGEKDKAISIANKAIVLAKEQNVNHGATVGLLKRIEQGK